MPEVLETHEFAKEFFTNYPKWMTEFTINGISNNGFQNKDNDWGITKLNTIFPLHDQIVLELGSQEGGHTRMLHNFGAKKICALEGRLESYVKSCVIKNIFELYTAKFFVEDLRKVDLKKFGFFDICVCSGLLYHLPEPQELLAKISDVATRILINTHYIEDENNQSKDVKEVSLKGKKYYGKLYDEVNAGHPNSGLQQYSFWPFRNDLIQMIKDVGFENLQVLRDWTKEETKTSSGITLFAQKPIVISNEK